MLGVRSSQQSSCALVTEINWFSNAEIIRITKINLPSEMTVKEKVDFLRERIYYFQLRVLQPKQRRWVCPAGHLSHSGSAVLALQIHSFGDQHFLQSIIIISSFMIISSIVHVCFDLWLLSANRATRKVARPIKVQNLCHVWNILANVTLSHKPHFPWSIMKLSDVTRFMLWAISLVVISANKNYSYA